MMKRRRMLGLAAACALAFTGSFAGYADPVTYDQTADASYGGQTFNFDAGTPTVYPGDTVYGPVTIYLGADNAAGGKAEQLETDDSGTPYFKDKTAAVYKVTDVTPESSGETEMVPVTDEAGNPVLNEDGSSAMQAVAAADPDPAYQFDLAGYVVEAVYGTLSGETGDVDSVSSLQMTAADGSQSEVTPDAKYYAEGTDVTLTADPAPEGLSFAGWTVTEITDDGTVSQAGDVASLNLAGLTAETITYPGLTFTMGKPEHVLIFTAQYAQTVTDTEAPAEAQAETPDAADALAADASGAAESSDSSASSDAGAAIDTSDAASDEGAAVQDGIVPEASSVNVSVSFISDDGTDSTIVNPYSEGFSQDINTAASNPQGQIFDHWESQDASAVFADPASAATTLSFIDIPSSDVAVQAVYRDASADSTADASAAETTADSAADTAAAEETADASGIAADNSTADEADANSAAGQNGASPAQEAPAAADNGQDAASSGSAATENSQDQAAAVYKVTADQNTTVTLSEGTDPQTVAAGTTVTLQAQDLASQNKKFTGFTLTGVDTSGIDLTKASITFAMPAANVEATANYETISYSITAAPGSGASDPYTEVTLTTQDGTSLYSGKGPVSGVSAAAGTVVTAALKNTSAKLKLTWKDGTSDGITDNGNGSYTFTLNGDASLIYTASETYQVTVSVSGGVITNDGNKTGGSYLSGTELTVQANVPANNIFEGWTVSDPALASVSDAGAESTTLTIAGELTASGSVTLTANFKPVTYNLTVVSGSGNGQYASATPASISADAPKAGYKFSGWTLVSGSGTFADQKAASTTFTCGSDAKVQANYEPIPYKITVKNGKPSGTYTVGQDIDLVPDFPAAGKEFDKWSVTSGKLSIDYKDSYYATATVQASDATVTALYKNGPSPDNNAITGLQNDMEYLKSSTLTFNAVGAGMDNDNPNPGDYRYRPTGYQIGSVTGNWSQAPYQTSMAINAVGDYTLTVTFAREVYDGSTWNADGSTDSKSITFHVVNTLSVETGDTSPVMTFIVLGLAALAVAVAIGTAFVVRDRKRRRG